MEWAHFPPLFTSFNKENMIDCQTVKYNELQSHLSKFVKDPGTGGYVVSDISITQTLWIWVLAH